jgi:hypothetical protein
MRHIKLAGGEPFNKTAIAAMIKQAVEAARA